MWKFSEKSPRCCCHLLVVLFMVAVLSKSEEVKDFIAVNKLPDGEVETRVFYDGIYGKEIAAARRFSSSVKFRQLANNLQLIQLIYNNDEDLQDCQILHGDKTKKFLSTFKTDLSNLIATSNITIESLNDKNDPHDLPSWFNLTETKQQCKKLHHRMKQKILEAKSKEDNERFRRKRSIFIAPGTLWCGDASNAKSYTDLGVLQKTDKCCRKHDHCRRIIPGFSTNFNYHNLSPFTLSHCNCDTSFRACLKRVDTSDANLVGKLFFNVVQTKCFLIKPKKVCKKRSWWGQCEKHHYVKKAILRDNLRY